MSMHPLGAVFLLTKNIHLAQRMTQYFKEYHIKPYIFEQIKSIWEILGEARPSILLIDVKMGKEEGFDLKLHPYVMAQKLHIGSLLDPNDPVGNLQWENYFKTLVHDGVIVLGEGEKESLGQFLQRINKYLVLEHQLSSLQRTWDQQKNELERAQLRFQNDFEKNQLLLRWIHKVESLRYDDFKENFVEKLAHFFNYWESFVDKFSFYLLGPHLDQLVSPPLKFSRYQGLHITWCTEKMLEGIDFAQKNIAYEHAMDLFGQDTLLLSLKKQDYKTDFLIFVKPTPESKGMIKNINWSFFEEILSQYWNRYQQEISASINQRYPILELWDVMGPLLEQELYLEENKRDSFFLIHLDTFKSYLFSSQVVLGQVQWKAFMDHFCQEIRDCFPQLRYFCFISLDAILVCVDRKKSLLLYGELFHQDILYDVACKIKKFSFLKYFDLALGHHPLALEQLERYYPQVEHVPFIHQRIKDILLQKIPVQTQGGKGNEKRKQERASAIRPLAYSQNQ